MTGGSISVAGATFWRLAVRGLREYRAHTVSMVYQNPGAALNPRSAVGAQVAEAFTVLGASGSEASERRSRHSGRVQIADPRA